MIPRSLVAASAALVLAACGGSSSHQDVDPDADGDGFPASVDCDDGDGEIHPGAVERCNQVDDDCDGTVDEDLAVTAYYLDADGDGYGLSTASVTTCAAPAGYAAAAGDCGDGDAEVHPGAAERCNQVDDDCDGSVDEELTFTTYYLDADGDGYGLGSAGVTACAAPAGYVATAGDCDDGDASIHPDTGTCDGSTAHLCGADGTWAVAECDAVQGSACSAGHCSGPCALEALGASYIGCDYYATPTSNSMLQSATSFHFAVVVTNAGSQAATVTVTQGETVVTAQEVAAGAVQVFTLPWTSLRTATATMIGTDAAAAYRVRSTQPVSVYQFNPLEYLASSSYSYTNDASLLLPANTWGADYVVASRKTLGGTSPGFYAVVASEDGTVVTVSPSATGGTILAGGGLDASGTGSVTLARGQVLQVLSGAGDFDLTGTRVTASKPVQVLGGHNCTYVPDGVMACDHLEESMLPVAALGTDYLATAALLPGASTPKAILARVIATEAGTSLTYDPPLSGAATSLAAAGDFVEVTVADAVRITSDKPVLVAEYMRGQSAGGNAGDPSLSVAVSIDHYRTSYLFYAPLSYASNYVDISGPLDAQVTLDGQPVGAMTAIGSSGYGVVRVSLSSAGTGAHLLSATRPVGIGVYGYGEYTSYWYPGGMDVGN